MDFLNDELGRQKFADLLLGFASNLASTEILPTGRVIAVDSPWGSGKSWVAKRIKKYSEADGKIGKCVYVDAFEFDYHQEPFAVVTSAILEVFKTDTPAVRNFKSSAIDVLRSTLPVVSKGAVKTVGRLIGLDTNDIYESIVEAGSEASEKAIDKMLDTFSKTKETTEAFKEKLSELAKTCAENKPLLIIIDELDRCRPSFALEMLERVKHLFDVPNVVFIFFVHTPALYSAIKKTYGQDINPTEYLQKFIAVTLGLPAARKSDHKKMDRSNFLRPFLDTQFPISQNGITGDEYEFRDAVIQIAPYFNASFREIERVMLLWILIKNKIKGNSTDIAYSLFLKIIDPLQFKELRNIKPSALKKEALRLGDKVDYESDNISHYRESFLHGASSTTEKPKNSEEATNISLYNNLLISLTHIIKSLDLEYIKI